MKILKKVIVILILILSIFSIKSFAATGKVNVAATRLRKEKNTTSEILTKIYEDEEVEILEEIGEWLKVKHEKYTGYVKKEYVTINENSKDQETNQKDKFSTYEDANKSTQNTNEVTVVAETSLRILPNFMSKQIQDVQKETVLTIVSQMNNWIQVTDGFATGWILKTKVNFQNQAPQVEPSDIETTNTISNTTSTSNTVKNETNTVNKNTNTTSQNTTNTTNTGSTNTASNTTTQSAMSSVSKKGKVNVETANVRKEPSTSAKRIEFLDEGDIVKITEENNEWYKVEHEDIKGYVSKSLITIIEENTVTSRSLTEERQELTGSKEETSKEAAEQIEKENKEETSNLEISSVSGNQVVEYAKQYLGYKYVVGGKTPESGFDCSGFTRYIYKHFGYSLSSVSYEQTSVGAEVKREDLQPGDLILFYNEEKTKIGHTGVYIGNGDFIHAANAKRGIVCDNLNTLTYYNERFVTARRIVQ